MRVSIDRRKLFVLYFNPCACIICTECGEVERKTKEEKKARKEMGQLMQQ